MSSRRSMSERRRQFRAVLEFRAFGLFLQLRLHLLQNLEYFHERRSCIRFFRDTSHSEFGKLRWDVGRKSVAELCHVKRIGIHW